MNTSLIDDKWLFEVKSAMNQKQWKIIYDSKYLNKTSFLNLKEDQIVLEGLSQNLEYF